MSQLLIEQKHVCHPQHQSKSYLDCNILVVADLGTTRVLFSDGIIFSRYYRLFIYYLRESSSHSDRTLYNLLFLRVSFKKLDYFDILDKNQMTFNIFPFLHGVRRLVTAPSCCIHLIRKDYYQVPSQQTEN